MERTDVMVWTGNTVRMENKDWRDLQVRHQFNSLEIF